MPLPPIAISGHGMEITKSIERYINEKIIKHDSLFSIATGITVECTQSKAARGVDNDYRIETAVMLPRVTARVEKNGADIYAVFDEVIDVLLRKLKRYKDMHHKWEGKKPWKVEYMEKMTETNETEVTDFVDYVPKIVERITLENCTPMSEAEAIEQMELTDLQCFLFKKKDTGRFTMVYKRKRGGYGIVEPCS